jgi:hypothetical protein
MNATAVPAESAAKQTMRAVVVTRGMANSVRLAEVRKPVVQVFEALTMGKGVIKSLSVVADA